MIVTHGVRTEAVQDLFLQYRTLEVKVHAPKLAQFVAIFFFFLTFSPT